MIRQPTLSGCLLVAILAACGPRPVQQLAAPTCHIDWQPAWGPDSIFTICLPPGFALREPGVWARPRLESAAVDFLSVDLLRGTTDFDDFAAWPPRLTTPPDCLADCTVAESVTVFVDSVSGFEAHTEAGLVSGGFAGLRRAPHFVSGWRSSATSGGFAQGWAAQLSTLDTLRLALRSLRVRS